MGEREQHPSKVSGWRDGALVVLPEALGVAATVWFAAGPTAPEGLKWEALLCTPLSEDRVRLCSIPFWLYNLNLGDEVFVAKSAEGQLVATGIAVDSGNLTYRVILPRDDAWQLLMVDLEPLGCWFDIRTPTYLAISCSPADASEVAGELQRREACGDLQYEAGRTV